MKLPELKRKFRNKYVIRIAAGVLTVTLFDPLTTTDGVTELMLDALGIVDSDRVDAEPVALLHT